MAEPGTEIATVKPQLQITADSFAKCVNSEHPETVIADWEAVEEKSYSLAPCFPDEKPASSEIPRIEFTARFAFPRPRCRPNRPRFDAPTLYCAAV